MKEIIEGEISALTSEGQGILRQNNFVIFTPYTAPQDVVKVEIEHKKKSYGVGKLLEIISPSPDRTSPLCRYYGVCGGCQLQHINYAAQLKSKQETIQNAFKRIGKLENVVVNPVMPATMNWAYRRHVTLKLKPEGDAFIAGYVSTDNKSIVQVEHCPIFISEESPVLMEVRSLIQSFRNKNSSEGSAVLFKEAYKNNLNDLSEREVENDKMMLHLFFDQQIDYSPEKIKSFMQENPRWVGITLQQGSQQSSWGEKTSYIHVEGLKFLCSPTVFTQNHPEQSLKIYKQIVHLAGEILSAKILDLYCGIGISSLLLAQQGHQVTGVEYSPESIDFAKENSDLNQIGSAHFIQGDVEKILRKELKQANADIIITNPPRIGMSPVVIQEIIRLNPQMIIYISCMPSTLARDLQLLISQGYGIDFVQPYDMFPQTSHVETVVRLRKRFVYNY
jgi:23S rRNA (uracil1939-C5)-methyltransferase